VLDLLEHLGGKQHTKRCQPAGTAPAKGGIFIFILAAGLLYVAISTGFLSEGIFVVALLAGAISVLAGPAVTWGRVIELSPQPEGAHQARSTAILMVIALFPLAWLPFVGWVYGVLPQYNLAVMAALLIVFLSLWMGMRRIRRAAGLYDAQI
jgi:hypothetical protein